MSGRTTVTEQDGIFLANVEPMIANLDSYKESMRKQVERGLLECGGELSRRSILLVPKVTGEQAARAFVSKVLEDEDGQPAVVVGYEQHGAPTGMENPDAEGDFYAVPLHERVYAKHEKGQAKFLEDAVNEYENEFLNDMRDRCREAKP